MYGYCSLVNLDMCSRKILVKSRTVQLLCTTDPELAKWSRSVFHLVAA